MIDLGSERLLLTRAFGDDIERCLDDPQETNPAILAARKHLSGGEGKHIIGAALNQGTKFYDHSYWL